MRVIRSFIANPDGSLSPRLPTDPALAARIHAIKAVRVSIAARRAALRQAHYERNMPHASV